MTDCSQRRGERSGDREASKRRSGGAFVLGLALCATFAASPASASPDTLRLAFEDMIMGAADIVVSPVNAGRATHENLDYVSDNGFLQALYAVPAFVGNSALQAGQGGFRILVGALQILPGIALFPFEADVSEDFNIFRRGTLMADLENPLGENPPWLAYVLPVTPFTIDARIGPMCPWARYAEPVKEPESAFAGR